MNFKCPHCDGESLVEIQYNVTITMLVSDVVFDDDGEFFEVLYDNDETDYNIGAGCREFRCSSCNNPLKLPGDHWVDSDEDLAKWLRQHNQLGGRRCLGRPGPGN